MIELGGNVACYIPMLDKIKMPEITGFVDLKVCSAAEASYATTFHELVHWSGAEKRLDRGLSTNMAVISVQKSH